MDVTCFHVLDPPLYLSDAAFVQPRNLRDEILMSRRFRKLGITTVINMSCDSRASSRHKSFYSQIGVQLVEIPIEDSSDISLNSRKVLNQVVEEYQGGLVRGGSVLVHCTMGVNRSAFAAGAILWSQVDRTAEDALWNDPESMIEWMRQCQKRDRGLKSLLENSWMEFSLKQWCLPRDRRKRRIED